MKPEMLLILTQSGTTIKLVKNILWSWRHCCLSWPRVLQLKLRGYQGQLGYWKLPSPILCIWREACLWPELGLIIQTLSIDMGFRKRMGMTLLRFRQTGLPTPCHGRFSGIDPPEGLVGMRAACLSCWYCHSQTWNERISGNTPMARYRDSKPHDLLCHS